MAESKKFPSDVAEKVLVRLDQPNMREQLKALAKQSGRKTVNAEINAALLAHIANGGNAQGQTVTLSEADMDKLADKVAARLKS